MPVPPISGSVLVAGDELRVAGALPHRAPQANGRVPEPVDHVDAVGPDPLRGLQLAPGC